MRLSSLPRPQGALPRGFSAAPRPASRRGGAGEAPGLPRHSEGNHLGDRPWSAAGAPGSGPRVAQVISRREHLLVCAGRLLPGPGCSPPRGGPGPQPIASCFPHLNSWGDHVFVKLGPGPARPPHLPTRRGRAALSGPGRTSPRLHLRRRAQPAPSGLQRGQARSLRFASARPAPGTPALVRPSVARNLCP